MENNIKYERDGQWFTIDQIREQRNAEKIRKQIEKDSEEEGAKGKEEVSVCVRNTKKDMVETKKKKEKVIEVEMGKGNELDEVFVDEETTDPEPTLEEIKSKK